MVKKGINLGFPAISDWISLRISDSDKFANTKALKCTFGLHGCLKKNAYRLYIAAYLTKTEDI